MAAPAPADDRYTDENYLIALELGGVPIGEPAKAIATGHQVCADLHNGIGVAEAAVHLTRLVPEMSPVEAALTIGFSVAAYCPELEHILNADR